MSIRKVVAGLLITAGIAIMAFPFFSSKQGTMRFVVRCRYKEAADE